MKKIQGTADGSLYRNLPYNITQNKTRLGIQPLNCSAKEFVESFLNQTIQSNEAKVDAAWKRKAIMLDANKRTRHKRSKVKMSAKEKKEKGLYDLSKGSHKYEMYIPLHKLWTDYIQQVLNLNDNSILKDATHRLLKADFHGSLMTVHRSKCPSYIGISGIVLQETKNVFKIITRDDQIKVIPKANSVFSIEINNFIFKIYGNQFRYKASERSVRKFKAKPTLDL